MAGLIEKKRQTIDVSTMVQHGHKMPIVAETTKLPGRGKVYLISK